MPKLQSTRVPAEAQLGRLKQQHDRLKAEVAELDRRMHLNMRDELRLQRLKKEKLWTKDRIQSLRQYS